MRAYNPYDPCPCGSGEKYKFCCLEKQRMSRNEARQRPMPGELSPITDEHCQDFFKVQPIIQKGLARRNRGDFIGAAAILQSAVSKAPHIAVAGNNLALCLFYANEPRKAVSAQLKTNADSVLPNPFGMASLAIFYRHLNRDDEAGDILDDILDMRVESVDGCLNICMALALYKRHADILKIAGESKFNTHPSIQFYMGTAAANTEQYELAKLLLAQIGIQQPMRQKAQSYLKLLQKKKTPHTVCGDWPYFTVPELIPLLPGLRSERRDSLKINNSSGLVVDFAESMLNLDSKGFELPMHLLGNSSHPDSLKLAYTIARGSFGPDELRVAAVFLLKEKGALEESGEIEILQDGKLRAVEVMRTQINPDFKFCEDLPENLHDAYVDAVLEMHERDPDLEFCKKTFENIQSEAPYYFPARYNYACCLLQQGRRSDAEVIIREIYEEHPDYLFAPATLSQLLSEQDRTEEAEEILLGTAMPRETHPDALAQWHLASAIFFLRKGEMEQAMANLEALESVDPENEALLKMREDTEFRELLDSTRE